MATSTAASSRGTTASVHPGTLRRWVGAKLCSMKENFRNIQPKRPHSDHSTDARAGRDPQCHGCPYSWASLGVSGLEDRQNTNQTYPAEAATWHSSSHDTQHQEGYRKLKMSVNTIKDLTIEEQSFLRHKHICSVSKRTLKSSGKKKSEKIDTPHGV